MSDYLSEFASNLTIALGGGAVGVAVAVVVLPPAYLLALLVHESGHVLAASVGGIPVRAVRFGRGRPWLVFRLFGVRITLAGWLRGGLVTTYYNFHVSKTALVAYALGGSGLNLLAAAAFAFVGMRTESDIVLAVVCVAGSGQLLMGVKNLQRFRTRNSEGRDQLSDGAWARAMLRLDMKPLQALIKLRLASFASYGEPPKTYGAAVARIWALHEESENPDPEVRRRNREDMDYERLRSHPRSLRLFLLESGVTRMLYDDGEADLVRLADWAEELGRLAPDLPTVRGSIGGAKVLLGRPAQARDDLLAAAQGPPFDRLLSMAFLARAEAALGNMEAAQNALVEAFRVAEANSGFRELPAGKLLEATAAKLGFAPALA